MISDIILTTIGWGIFLLGFIWVGCILMDKEEKVFDRIFTSFIIGGLTFIFFLIFQNCPMTHINRDIRFEYIIPSSIVKTNNITLVNHIGSNGVVATLESKDAIYWNATNIMVEVLNGKTIYGNEGKVEYKIVIMR